MMRAEITSQTSLPLPYLDFEASARSAFCHRHCCFLRYHILSPYQRRWYSDMYNLGRKMWFMKSRGAFSVREDRASSVRVDQLLPSLQRQFLETFLEFTLLQKRPHTPRISSAFGRCYLPEELHGTPGHLMSFVYLWGAKDMRLTTLLSYLFLKQLKLGSYEHLLLKTNA